MKIRSQGLVLCLLMFVVGGIAFYLQKPSTNAPPLQARAAAPAVAALEHQSETPPPPALPAESAVGEVPPPVAAPALVPDYEYKISRVLNGGLSAAQTAQLLIDLVPGLPPAGQAEAAQHICNLITEDRDYDRIRPLIHNLTLPQPVQDVFMTDLLNRADNVKLPTLLEIAEDPAHPFRADAKTYLSVYLNGDQGPDWPRWSDAVKQYLVKERALVNGDPR